MFQEIELLAAIAVFLPFFAAFAYHLTFAQNTFADGVASHSTALQRGILLQQEINAYSVSGVGGLTSGTKVLNPANPFVANGNVAGGRLVSIGGSVYVTDGVNET
ncbi:MAG TPA: hypothetical protein VND15_01835 [Candidatus Acidoferrales bacterium]|nr:hypothetical protein [Candidatus Acidoferrales bacterium]